MNANTPYPKRRKHCKIPLLLHIIPREHSRTFIITVGIKDFKFLQLLYIFVNDDESTLWYKKDQDREYIKELLDIRLEYEDGSPVDGTLFILL